MPDILIVSRDDKSCFELEELVRRIGFRTKTTVDTATAEEWLKTLPFDGLLITAGFGVEAQQSLAGRLWQANALAPVIMVDLEMGSDALAKESRLMGAEVFYGRDAGSALSERLKQLLASERSVNGSTVENFGIMVVEDLDSPRDIICMFIESLGYPQVSGWNSARAAMNELLAHPEKYSCVVTDIKMPEINGRELVEFIRAHPKLQHLPVIVLTAYGTVDTLIDCLKAGATGFLIKPPKKKDLGWELARSRRIMAHGSNPRLTAPDDAEAMRDLLIDRGFM